MVSGECVGLDTDVESNRFQEERRMVKEKNAKQKLDNTELVVQGHFT